MLRLLAVLAALAYVHARFGAPGLTALSAGYVLYLLLRTRPFTSCARCRGHGSLTRRLGAPVACRSCRGTGLGTRADRRNAPYMPPKNRSGR